MTTSWRVVVKGYGGLTIARAMLNKGKYSMPLFKEFRSINRLTKTKIKEQFSIQEIAMLFS